MRDFVIYTGTLGILIAVSIIWLIRKDLMHVRYSLWWLVVAIGIMLLGWFPGLMDGIGEMMGVAYPPAVLFLVAIVALLIKALLGDIERSKTSRRTLRLTQRLAILENRLHELEAENRSAESEERTGGRRLEGRTVREQIH